MLNYLKGQLQRFKLPIKVDKVFVVNDVVHFKTQDEFLEKIFILNNDNELILHHEADEPAVKVVNKSLDALNDSVIYYKNGEIHRDKDKPAFEAKNETDLNLLLCCFDLKKYIPDFIFDELVLERGFKAHFQNGKLHCKKYPAISSNKSFMFDFWFYNGLLHNDNDRAARYCNIPQREFGIISRARAASRLRDLQNKKFKLGEIDKKKNVYKNFEDAFYFYEGEQIEDIEKLKVISKIDNFD